MRWSLMRHRARPAPAPQDGALALVRSTKRHSGVFSQPGEGERAEEVKLRQRVLILHPSDEAYGADRIVSILACELTRRGHSVRVVIADDGPPGWLSANLELNGVPYCRRPLAAARRSEFTIARIFPFLVRLWSARKIVRREARSFNATVIHINTSALLVGAIIGRPGSASRVWHVHEIIVRPRFMRWLFRFAVLGGGDRVLAVSGAVRDHLGTSRLASARVITIHNGIEPHAALRTNCNQAKPQTSGLLLGESNAVVVAFVGRLNRWKGYEVFIDAARMVATKCPGATFVIVGDPPTTEAWRADDVVDRVRASRMETRIAVLGFRPEARKLLQDVDILIVPSVWPDPFPTVILEGMSASCAVIASRLGGAVEMLEDGVSGLFFDPGSSESLADKIAALVDDAPLRRRLGAAAKIRADTEFTIPRFVDRVEAVYASILPGSTVSRRSHRSSRQAESSRRNAPNG